MKSELIAQSIISHSIKVPKQEYIISPTKVIEISRLRDEHERAMDIILPTLSILFYSVMHVNWNKN